MTRLSYPFYIEDDPKKKYIYIYIYSNKNIKFSFGQYLCEENTLGVSLSRHEAYHAKE